MVYNPLAWIQERIVRPTYRRVYKPSVERVGRITSRVEREARQYVPTVSYKVAAERRRKVVTKVKEIKKKILPTAPPPTPVGFQEKIVSQRATALTNLESQYIKAGRIAPTGEFLPTSTMNVERKYVKDIMPTGEFKATHTDATISKWAPYIRGQSFIGSKEQFTHYQSEFNTAQRKDKARYNAYKKDWGTAQQADKTAYGAYQSKFKEYESERTKLTKLKVEKQKELKEFVTYPIYRETAKFGEWWEERIAPKRLRPEIPTAIKPLAKFGIGIIRSPGQIVSFFGMVPPAIEYAVRDADEFAASLVPGAVVAVKGMAKRAKEEPFEFAGETVGMLGLTYGVGRVIRHITPKIITPKIPKIRKPKITPRRVERPFTLRDIEMAEKQAAIAAKEVPIKVEVVKAPIKEPYAISKTIKEIRQADAGISRDVLKIKPKEVSPWERVTVEDIYREAGIRIKPKREPWAKIEKPEWLVKEIRETRIRERPVEEYYFPEEYIPLPEIKAPIPIRKMVVITKERVIPEIKVAKVLPEIKVMPEVKVKVAPKTKVVTRVLTEADRSAAYLPKRRLIVGVAPLTKTETAILTEIREKTAIKPLVEAKIKIKEKVKVKEKVRVKVMPLVIPKTEIAVETEVVTMPKTMVLPEVITELKVEPITKIGVPVIVEAPPIEKIFKPKPKKKEKKKRLTVEEELEKIYRKRKYPTLTPEQMLKM